MWTITYRRVPMTKRDFVVRISKEMGLAQEDVMEVVQKFLDHVTEAVGRGEHVEFREFGVFEIAVRRPRIGRNPKRPQDTVRIPERKVVKFKAGKQMKALVAKL
jgi:nucleoid DNA-binding protein